MSSKRKPRKRVKSAVRKPMPKPTQAHKVKVADILEDLWRKIQRQELND